MLEVVTVWAPRPENEKFSDVYKKLLKLQLFSVNRVGHTHVVVTDDPKGVSEKHHRVITASMQASLMFAILEGQLAYVEQWDGSHPFVLLDIDCLVARKLEGIFTGAFDIMLTNRNNPVAPIQNGAMYFDKGCKLGAIKFLRRALQLCEHHWGGDQEAIAKAMAPVPDGHVGIERRFGVRVKFSSPELYNHSNKVCAPRTKDRYVFHFKGDSKKFARPFFEQLSREPVQ